MTIPESRQMTDERLDRDRGFMTFRRRVQIWLNQLLCGWLLGHEYRPAHDAMSGECIALCCERCGRIMI